jgi:hypothetical protein
MSDIGYCKFENVVSDMEKCIEAFSETDWDINEMIENASSEKEALSMRKFIKLCQGVTYSFDGIET